MKQYKIINIGCDDETLGVFELTEEQYKFLDKTFEELNKNSDCGCMPEIYIEPMDKYVGMTLAEIDEEQKHYNRRSRMCGVTVVILQDESDNFRELLFEDWSISSFVFSHPEYANCKVKDTSEFNGETVFRVVIDGGEKQ